MMYVQAAEKEQKKKQKAEEQQRKRAEEKKAADKEAQKKGAKSSVAKGKSAVGESSSSVQVTQTSQESQEKRASGRLTRSSATRPASSVVVNKTAEAKSKANNKAKEDDPESEEVGSQALPSLMASKLKASKGDAGIDDFDDFDDDGEEEKMKKRRFSSDEKKTTADSQKMPKLDKASAEDKGRPQRLSIAKVKEIEEQGEIGKTRMGKWAKEAAKEAYEQKQKGKRGSKLPPAPLKNRASNDGKKKATEETNGQDDKKMATESRPLPKPLSKKSCGKKLEMERKASELDKDDAMKEEDPKSKTEEGAEGAAGKADPWADDYQLEETNQSPEEKRNGIEQQRVTRQSAAKDGFGSKRQSDGSAKALDASTISGLTTVDRDKASQKGSPSASARIGLEVLQTASLSTPSLAR